MARKPSSIIDLMSPGETTLPVESDQPKTPKKKKSTTVKQTGRDVFSELRPQILFSESTLVSMGAWPEVGPFETHYAAPLPPPEVVPLISLDVETTSKHPDEDVPVSKSTSIGGTAASSIGKWLKAGFGTVDTTPRMRIVTVRYEKPSANAFDPPEAVVIAWDFDKLTPPERRRLVRDIMHQRILLGHNIPFDLTWMLHEYMKEGGAMDTVAPRDVIDTMLLIRMCPRILTQRLTKNHVIPPDLWKPIIDAESDESESPIIDAEDPGEPPAKKNAGPPLKKLFSKDTPRVSLAVVGGALGYGSMDKTFQKPQNWMLSRLTNEHYAYVSADVDVPLKILKAIANEVASPSNKTYSQGEDPVAGQRFSNTVRAVDFLKKEWPWLQDYSNALWREVRMGRRGLPFDRESARQMVESLMATFNSAVAQIVAVPEFAVVADTLTNPKKGEEASTRRALAAYAATKGITLGTTEKGDLATGDDALAFVGLAKDPVVKAYSTRRQLQRNIDSVSRWMEYSNRGGGFVHSLIAHRAVTLRTSAESPNTQNFPAADEYRRLIHAKKGFKFFDADYSAIELVIAAALGVQAVDRMRRAVERNTPPSPGMKWIWKGFMHHIESGRTIVVPPTPDPNNKSQDFSVWGDYYSALLADLYLKARSTPLREVFRRGVDPHLATCMRFINYDTKGMSPIEYLASLPHHEAEALKETLKGPRKQAKAANFGLLYGSGDAGLHKYGIASYGLNWSIEEAATTRMAWLDMNPDIRLFQLVERLSPVEKNVPHWTEHGWVDSGKLYRVHTLAGREMETFILTNALNWRDQGTGADIAARAIRKLPREIEESLVLFAHDELLFHAPENRIQVVQEVVPHVMVEAAEDYLAEFGVPVKTEFAIGDTWGHSPPPVLDVTDLPLSKELAGPGKDPKNYREEQSQAVVPFARHGAKEPTHDGGDSSGEGVPSTAARRVGNSFFDQARRIVLQSR